MAAGRGAARFSQPHSSLPPFHCVAPHAHTNPPLCCFGAPTVPPRRSRSHLERVHGRCPRLGHLHTEGYALAHTLVLSLGHTPTRRGTAHRLAGSAAHTSAQPHTPRSFIRPSQPRTLDAPSSPYHPRRGMRRLRSLTRRSSRTTSGVVYTVSIHSATTAARARRAVITSPSRRLCGGGNADDNGDMM